MACRVYYIGKGSMGVIESAHGYREGVKKESYNRLNRYINIIISFRLKLFIVFIYFFLFVLS